MFLHTEPFPQRSLRTEQFSHMFFLHKKPFDTEKLVHTDCTQKFTFLHADTLPRAVFTQQKLFCTEAFAHKKNMHNSFYRQTAFTHRKFSAEKSYAQKVLRTTIFTYGRFYTQMSSHRHKLHTETCAHSMRLHTAYTQPLFTQRGFASPSESPTFRVPPLKYIYIYIYLFIYSFIYLFIIY